MSDQLFHALKKQCYHFLSNEIPFAFYQLPSTASVKLIAGKFSVLATNTTNKGFLLHPFHATKNTVAYLIEDDKKALKATNDKLSTAFIHKKTTSVKKKDFIEYVELIQRDIKQGKAKKIVAARVKKVKRKKSFDPFSLFEKACAAYPDSFVSYTHIPQVGTWIGASPEVLVKETKKELLTYSLAGTQLNIGKPNWTEKEITEQQIVSDFIFEKLQSITKQKVKRGKTETVNAGSLRHLRTVFSCAKNAKIDWQKVASTLHPTPAVGGLPQKAALDFIAKNEHFDRAFYSGYVGPVNQSGETNLFVNLRCVEVTDKHLLFYAGCGITADSDAEKEWKETKAKMNILKKLL